MTYHAVSVAFQTMEGRCLAGPLADIDYEVKLPSSVLRYSRESILLFHHRVLLFLSHRTLIVEKVANPMMPFVENP